MKLRTILGGIGLFLLGFVAGTGLDAVKAQQHASPELAWEIYHAPFGMHSFYAIKHNRVTGETWVLSGEKGAEDDRWLLLPEEDKRSKK